ncbi:MAG: NAD(P)/FAD-dependent oxidoreductase [Myxococcales bacterium]|jgi:cation diffusion facilitator CzcD-associated flavoprotein CzcO|nr:MAG: NAD(P)/FAD-dependent oxidoreductase [Myxococcales bacterium]
MESKGTTRDDGERFDAIVVGAGFAGLYMLHRLRGLGLRVRVFEAGSGVGGTWYFNRYPGARCDVESMDYSYQFSDGLEQEWEWSERYAAQPEILRYIEHVAERFGLLRDVQLDTRVLSASFDDARTLWRVETDRGLTTAPFFIMATGCLSSAQLPEIAGMENFRGRVLHTGRWPHEDVDFRGKRVGVIGTGSSGVQAIPIIAEQAEELFVFQRTATYAVPAHNAPLDPDHQRDVKSRYREFRAAGRGTPLGFGADHPTAEDAGSEADADQRRQRFEEYWHRGGLYFMGAYVDLMLDPEVNESAAEFVREKIRGLVRDPETAALLSPSQVLGCKRLCAGTDYFETFNHDNVHLVDISREPIEEFTATGLKVGDVEHALDLVVLATGFDAMTGSLARVDIRGRRGLALKEKWAEGPKTYLGLGSAGFPNFFVIAGPGSPSVLTNMVAAIEQHVDWIAECIDHMRQRGLTRIEATTSAEEDWVHQVNELAGFTLFSSCNSWYLGANSPGKPRVFMPYLSFPLYVEKCDQVVAADYEGFELR